MRIGAVVVDLLDVKRVGSERRYGELLRRLTRRGCELHLFARRWDEAAARNLVCHRVPVRGPAALAPLVFAFSALRVTRPWRSRLDLVHSHTQSLGDDVVSPGGGAYLAYLRAVGRDPWGRGGRPAWRPQDHARVFLERRQLRSALRIVANSAWSARILADTYPFAAGRTRCVYNGVDAEHFSPRIRDELRVGTRARLGLAPREVAFLLVGTGIHRKGVLERRKVGRAFAYRAVSTREELESGLVTRALQPLLQGPQAEPILSFFVEEVSRQDQRLLDELERLVREKRRRQEER